MTHTIVVGFDDSDLSHLALDHAFANAAAYAPAEIHVLGVVDERLPDATFETACRLQDQIDEVVQSMAQTRPGLGLDVCVHTRIGKPADVILGLAREVDADLICVGSHGLTGLTRLLLGSVSEAVLRGADCPVLAARMKSYEPADEATTSPQLEPPTARKRLPPRRYTYRNRPRQGAIRHATAQTSAPMGPRPSVLERTGGPAVDS